MPKRLDDSARQCTFLITKAAVKTPLDLPEGWHSAVVEKEAELVDAIQTAETNNRRALALVSEKEFGPAVSLIRQQMSEEQRARLGIVVISDTPEPILIEQSYHSELLDAIPENILKKNLEFQLLRSVRQLLRKEEKEHRKITQKTLERLNQIFITLSAERDTQRLLATILAESMELTEAQKGTLYVVEEKDGELFLRMKMSNDGGDEMILQHINVKALEDNLCGYSVLTGKTMNIPIEQELRSNNLPSPHKAADHDEHEDNRSLLIVPLKNSRNEIVAVLQLANKKDHPDSDGTNSISFDKEDQSLLSSFATQAAICIENLELYGDIRGLFDGFAKAAITAIESRDPSTGGHSERVAKMTVALAEATNDCTSGIYRSVKFKSEEMLELEYAALLHDFGKIGVREEVLVKAKKLYAHQLEGIRQRMKIWKAALRIQMMELLHNKKNSESSIKKKYDALFAEVDQYWDLINQANEPSVLKQEAISTLEKIYNSRMSLPGGEELRILTDDEYEALSIPMGSLTNVERLEVESHVRHTYQFLKMIPWTKSFRNLPEIAYAHHEKLDGTGYPRALTSHEIPLQSKIMTVADIYDALTAADRWYKDAVPTEKAIDILGEEVKEGKLDPILYEIFLEKRIYELTSPKNMKRKAG